MKKYIISFAMLLTSVSLAAQENSKTVTGQVVDAATGKPLAGVIVSAYDNQRLTTMTDEDGKYELKVPEDTRSILLRVDGYNLQQRAIRGQKADVNYVDLDGKDKTFNCDNKVFQTDPTKVDTVVLAEAFHFPASNYGQSTNKFNLTLKCNIGPLETSKFSREMLLDCIYLRPRTSKDE